MLKIIVVILLMADFAASKRIQQEKAKVTKVLISTGDATGTTEIIDLVKKYKKSPRKLKIMPFFCGGNFTLDAFATRKFVIEFCCLQLR